MAIAPIVREVSRQIIGTTGQTITLHDITSCDLGGHFMQINCAEGLAHVALPLVFMMVSRFEPVALPGKPELRVISPPDVGEPGDVA